MELLSYKNIDYYNLKQQLISFIITAGRVALLIRNVKKTNV